MKDSNIILVPTDFSAVAECATNHAIKIASTLKGSIALLHVVSKQKDVEFTRERLEKITDEIQGKHNIKATPIVRIGNIFEDIGEVASEIAAKLIIMGTHGMKGLQFLTGSHALKVITSSQVPFIVVQEKPIKHGYSDIVLPLDLGKDTKQKLALTVMMAKNFKSTIHIIIPNEDDEFLLNTINRNLTFTKKNLDENQIKYTVKTAEGGNFPKQIIKYAVSIDADLIAIMNEEAGSDEQAIIANDPQIPVLCMNPATVTISRGVFAS